MNWKELKELFDKVENKELVKAIISYEKDINNDSKLNKMYEDFFENNYNLLNDNF